MSSRRPWILIIGLVSALLLGVGVAVAGGGASDKLLTGDNVSVGEGETIPHDLYVFGGDVIVDGTVEGDLVVGAGTVTINGTVDGDLVAGSGRAVIAGEVTGDVRIGAGEVTVSGTVSEDLLAGAGMLRVSDGGEVGEDLIFGAGTVMIAGDVAGNIKGSASTYERTGTVGGTEEVTLDAGGAPTEPEPEAPEAIRIAGEGLIQLVTVVLLGALALLIIPGAVRAAESALRRRPLASAGLGLGIIVGFIIQVIAVILLMILVAIAFSAVALDALSGIAVWLGIIDLMVSTFALVVSAAFIVDFVVGLALARLATRDWATNRWQELALLIGGAFVVVLVTSLPVIGGIAKLVVIFLGLGAMTIAFAEWWQRQRPPAAPVAAAVPAPAIPPTEPPSDSSAI
jgi:hypothetical protein